MVHYLQFLNQIADRVHLSILAVATLTILAVAVYIGSAFVISILLPFPIDWFVAIPVFLLISLYRRKLFLKKLGIKDKGMRININLTVIKNLFKSFPLNTLGSKIAWWHVSFQHFLNSPVLYLGSVSLMLLSLIFCSRLLRELRHSLREEGSKDTTSLIAIFIFYIIN